MSREKKDLTEDEKFEQQLQAEAKLGRLARTYTILDRNRAQFNDTGGKLAKQRKVLDIFKKEQKNILTDYTVASADARKKEDSKRSHKLANLLWEYDKFDDEIKIQKAHINEIDGQIKMVQKKVLNLGSKQITDDKYHQRSIKGEKTLQTLENKLEVQVKKFCAISSENITLRKEIDHLLIERNEFNKIWDRLINNLCIGKKFMIDLIEQATIAYDQREEWVSKLQFLRFKAHNDLLAHIQEMRILQRKRDNDEKLQEFFAIKGQKRIMKDLEEKELTKRRNNKYLMEKKLERYLEIMVAIQEFTGESKVTNITKKFLDQEEDNFAMFKYINHLNKEMEALSDNLGQLHTEIDHQEALHTLRKEQQLSKLGNLKLSFESIKAEADEEADKLKSVDQKLKQIMDGIASLFKMFNCKNDPLIQLLGKNETINYYNVILYLEILEKNIQEVMVSVYYREKNLLERKKIRVDQVTIPEIKVAPSIQPIEHIVLTNPCPLCIEHEQVSDVIDVLQHVYNKDQIQEKLKRRIVLGTSEDKLHNVSACHLPKSRQIIQKRYQ